jgi:hypothetical protein
MRGEDNGFSAGPSPIGSTATQFLVQNRLPPNLTNATNFVPVLIGLRCTPQHDQDPGPINISGGAFFML